MTRKLIQSRIILQEPQVLEDISKLFLSRRKRHEYVLAPTDTADAESSSLSDSDTRLSRPNNMENGAERNLSCCILMLDILLKQV